MGLPHMFNYFSYITLKYIIVLSGNSYHTNIILGGNFFLNPLHLYSVGNLNC